MIIAILLSLSTQAAEPKTNKEFYQLDYRERLSAEVNLPVLGGFEIQGSFETRYRPKKKETKAAVVQESGTVTSR